MLESVVEDYFIQQIERHGGLPSKFVSPSMLGVPDQIVLYKGTTYFAEIKAPGEKPRKSQVAVHELYKEYGVDVHVIDTKLGVDTFIKEVLKAKPVKKRKETFKLVSHAFATQDVTCDQDIVDNNEVQKKEGTPYVTI